MNNRRSLVLLATIFTLLAPISTATAAPGDSDEDGVGDAADNCPALANPSQENADGTADGGDACDPDDDNDQVNDTGMLGPLDNCRIVRNPNQNDGDADAVGDVCDPDIDDDGLANAADSDMDGDGASNNDEGFAGTDPRNRLDNPTSRDDETTPQCESSQPWVGYGRTHETRAFYSSVDRAQRVRTCEGEHWDGQDTVQPDHRPSTAGPACPSAQLPGDGVAVAQCMQPNPNFGESTILGFRLSTSGTDAYAAFTIGPLGRAAVSQTTSEDRSTTGLYLKDNTDGDLLATAVSATRLTRGFVRNGDCSQAQYEAGAYGESPTCGRDNTALTVEMYS